MKYGSAWGEINGKEWQYSIGDSIKMAHILAEYQRHSQQPFLYVYIDYMPWDRRRGSLVCSILSVPTSHKKYTKHKKINIQKSCVCQKYGNSFPDIQKYGTSLFFPSQQKNVIYRYTLCSPLIVQKSSKYNECFLFMRMMGICHGIYP